MADIKIKDLLDRHIFGAELFEDSENFMIELSDDDAIGGLDFNPPLHSCFNIGNNTCAYTNSPTVESYMVCVM